MNKAEQFVRDELSQWGIPLDQYMVFVSQLDKDVYSMTFRHLITGAEIYIARIEGTVCSGYQLRKW